MLERHLPDRVLCQFGGVLQIPAPCDTVTKLHQLDLRGKMDENWIRQHDPYLYMWQDRQQSIVPLEYDETLLDGVDSEYYIWYHAVTMRYIRRTEAMFGAMVRTRLMLLIISYY